MKVAEVVLVNQDDNPSIAQQAETRRDESALSFVKVVPSYLAMFEPRTAIIITGQQRQYLVFL